MVHRVGSGDSPGTVNHKHGVIDFLILLQSWKTTIVKAIIAIINVDWNLMTHVSLIGGN